MPYHQRLQLMGVTGVDANMQITDTGELSHFSVCVEEYWRSPATGEVKKNTTWFKCSAFGKIAVQAHKHLKRGTWVYVEGRMRAVRKGDKEYWGVNVSMFRDLTPREPSGEHHKAEDENQDTQQEA